MNIPKVNSIFPINKLGVTKLGMPVFYAPNPGSSQVGVVEEREVVKVIEQEGEYYYVKFYYNSKYYKYGYVMVNNISIPSYDYHSPILKGHRTADYGGYPTIPGNHNGIDIGYVGTTTPVYAIEDGQSKDIYRVKLINDEPYLCDYGQFAQLEFNNIKAIYGHLSKWSDNHVVKYDYKDDDEDKIKDIPLRKINEKMNADKYGRYKQLEYRVRSVSKGSLLGYTGSTGNSTGNHLHFGIKYSGSYVDPFDYVLFPGPDYLGAKDPK